MSAGARSTGTGADAEVRDLPARQYLDTTVVPTLLDGLKLVVNERPAKPLEFLAKYLLEQSKDIETGKKEG